YHREIPWVALPIVAAFHTDLTRRHVRHGELLAAIATAVEYRTNQILVLPGKATEQDRHTATFFCGKGPFDRTVEVCRLVKSGNPSQAHALRFQALLDFRVILNLDEIRRHNILRRCMEF